MTKQHCECPLTEHGHRRDGCKQPDLLHLGHVQGIGESTLCRSCIVAVLRQFDRRIPATEAGG